LRLRRHHRATGFTLIELIIVIVVIGILAAIVIARFLNAKDRAYVASMKSDLRNLAVYEQAYSLDNAGVFFSGDGASEGFNSTLDVTLNATATAGPPPNWSATATHAKSSKTCSIGVSNPAVWEVTCP
jgi:prepilin-type N-terminal cleavage/methylation domain-containing protein